MFISKHHKERLLHPNGCKESPQFPSNFWFFYTYVLWCVHVCVCVCVCAPTYRHVYIISLPDLQSMPGTDVGLILERQEMESHTGVAFP